MICTLSVRIHTPEVYRSTHGRGSGATAAASPCASIQPRRSSSFSGAAAALTKRGNPTERAFQNTNLARQLALQPGAARSLGPANARRRRNIMERRSVLVSLRSPAIAPQRLLSFEQAV